ncbi:MAG TPA: glycerophosphodiester phosphodiesterase [Thermomicrobiales bacterium]|nr:glycerophosphodiester phosphodiesterase [Thermomicrobiales bacterium]
MARPLIIAHRALSPGARENTASALARLDAAGADLAELDVRLSLDRRPFVLHDAFLRRTTRGHGWVRLWPSPLLRRLPLRDVPEGERLAPLSRVLATVPAGIQPALHLKDRGALRQVLRAIERHGTPGRTWLWLERPQDVARARRRLPELRCTLLRPAGWTATARGDYFHDAQRAGARAVSVPWGVITDELTAHAHRHGLLVFSRLEDPAAIPHVVRAGLDGIITDDPRTVADALAALAGNDR